jgi:DNA-binding XRE family transcriptional regulator
MLEKGTVQPRVGQAVQLVGKLTPDVGNFFRKLAEQEGFLVLPDTPGRRGMAEAENDFIKGLRLPLEKSEVKSIFGLMFKEVRLHYGTTQKAVAENARYNLRNLLNVESGNQEPGIMTALAMVCATGADVEAFFDKLHQLLC